jgi:hypothetical protein
MPSTDRMLELKARHQWLRPSHRRLCINRPSKFSRLTDNCVGERVSTKDVIKTQLKHQEVCKYYTEVPYLISEPVCYKNFVHQ